MQRADSLEKTPRLGEIECEGRGCQQRMRWLGGITDSTGMNLSKFWEAVEDIGAWLAVVHGVAKSQTQLSNRTATSRQITDKGPLKISDPHSGKL